jgi:hypothetical protein
VEIRKEHGGRAGPGDHFTMRFVLGSQYTTETAPRPADPAVRLTTTPPKERLAAVEFPGAFFVVFVFVGACGCCVSVLAGCAYLPLA